MARPQPFGPKCHGVPRVDHRCVLSVISFVNRYGLRWRDAPAADGLPKTLYSLWKRWRDLGGFARIFEAQSSEATHRKVNLFDATYMQAHRTESRLRLKYTGNVQRGRLLGRIECGMNTKQHAVTDTYGQTHLGLHDRGPIQRLRGRSGIFE